MRFVPPEDMTSAAVLAVHGWYRARAGRGWPARDSFRPEDLPAGAMRHLGLVDVETQPFRVFFRVVGDALGESIGRVVRTAYLDTLGLPQEAELSALYGRALRSDDPLFLKGEQQIDGHTIRIEGACFPLGSPTDEIRRFVIVEDYPDSRSWRAALRQRHYRVEED